MQDTEKARLFRLIATLFRRLMRAAEPATSRDIVIAGRFDHAGKRFGLGVPLYLARLRITESHGTRTDEHGADVVTLTRSELRVLTRMLTDLGESWDITLAELEGKTHA